nr:MAG TPA: hypothetical protein [Caudoviricetes sp.]
MFAIRLILRSFARLKLLRQYYAVALSKSIIVFYQNSLIDFER